MNVRSGLASGLAALVLMSGCVVASPDDDTYRDAAAMALATAASEVGTVELMLDLLDRDKITRPVVVAQVRYSEAGLEKTAAGFESLNPPPGEDGLGQSAGTLFDEAADAMQDARRAIERREIAQYTVISRQLGELASRLQTLEKSAS